MPYAKTDDSVKLYYEDVGAGIPVVFVHEFAGDLRSWEPQVGRFARRYRCVTYNARGYPPSDGARRSGALLASASARRHQGRARPSRPRKGAYRRPVEGGFATPAFGLAYPQRARSWWSPAAATAAEAARRDQFPRRADALAARFENEGSDAVAKSYAVGPTRVQFQNKDPLGWQRFADQLAGHSARGAALTMRGCRRRGPRYGSSKPRMPAPHRADPHHDRR